MSLNESRLVPLCRLTHAIVKVALICYLIILFNRQVLKVFVDKQKLNRKLLDFRRFWGRLALSIFQKV